MQPNFPVFQEAVFVNINLKNTTQIPIEGMGWVIGLAVANDKAFMYGGSQGCGFRWEPNNITVVDLVAKSAKKFAKVIIHTNCRAVLCNQ